MAEKPRSAFAYASRRSLLRHKEARLAQSIIKGAGASRGMLGSVTRPHQPNTSNGDPSSINNDSARYNYRTQTCGRDSYAVFNKMYYEESKQTHY